MQRELTSTFTLTVWLCVGAIAAAGDWPEFRGPTGQGIANGESATLPLTWSDSENVRWKVPIEGFAWSSPSIVGGRVYLTTAVSGERPENVAETTAGNADDAKSEEPAKPHVAPQSLEALCLNVETGAELWRVKLFEQSAGADIHDKNSHASPTPLVADGRIYVHFGPHGTACLTTDGEIVWKNTELKYGPRHGTGASPALAGDVIVVPCDGIDLQYVVGLEISTGAIRWKVERNANPQNGFSFCTPLVIDAGGRPRSLSGEQAVVAYDPATGRNCGGPVWVGYSVVRARCMHGLVTSHRIRHVQVDGHRSNRRRRCHRDARQMGDGEERAEESVAAGHRRRAVHGVGPGDRDVPGCQNR
jgi:outer membrane protein assembly factor BamB